MTPPRLALLLVFGLLFLTTRGHAQDKEAAAAPPAVDRTQIQAAVDRLTAVAEPDDATRQVLQQYQEALTAAKRIEEASTQEATLRREAAEAPRIEDIRAELEKPSADPQITPPADATLEVFEQQLAQANATLAAARAKAEELQLEATRRGERRTTIPDEITQARAELTEATTALQATPDDAMAPEMKEARAALLRARSAAASARIRALEAELASYDARRDLLPARRDLALRRVTDAEKLVKAWQDATNRKRALKATEDADRAEQQRLAAARQHKVLKDFAEKTEQFTQLRTGPNGLVKGIEDAGRELAATGNELTRLRTQFHSIRRRIDASGLNRATGLLLRRQYEDLPVINSLKSRVRSVVRDLEDADYNLIERDETRLGAGDIDSVVQELMGQIEETGGAEDLAELERAAREYASARRDLLDKLVLDSRTYRDTLVKLDLALRELLEATRASRAFVETRILWVRSFAVDEVPSVNDINDTLAWLFDTKTWATVWRDTTRFTLDRWLSTLLMGLSLILAVGAGRWARSRTKTLAGLVGKYKTDAFSHTIETVALALVAAIGIPLVLWWIAYLLLRVPEQKEAALLIADGLRSGAIFLFAFTFVRNCFARKGLVSAHFRWPEESISPIRRNLRWFIPTVMPMIVLVAGLDSAANEREAANASVGRLAFSVALLALAVFLYRVLRPSGPAMGEYLRRNSGGWIDRLRYIGFPSVVAVPIALIAATWAGYYYTAQQIQTSLVYSLLLAFALVLINGTLMRWLFVSRRQVALEDARRRRDEAKAEAKAAAEAGPAPKERATELPPLDVTKLDLPAISGQTRQLFRTAVFVTAIAGLFIIWVEKLPALQMFDRLQLWPTLTVLDTEDSEDFTVLEIGGARPVVAATTPAPPAEAPAGNGTSPTPQPGLGGLSNPTAAQTSDGAGADAITADPLSVTLADVGLAILVIVLTVVAFRNVPGVVEITVLKRLPLDAGSRYALSTVLRYAIAIIGVGIAFGALGISWSRVQWLAAALTFGLAFGLQEIFANFASGLIILAERPFRVGDTVTVGTVSGTVSRIRMRATTVLDWDRKELVIPNKTFITGEVINWTLTDPVLRVKVPVGVSYESDIDKVESLLLELANGVDSVLDDPKPQALFLGFGDSTLNFEVRVFIPHIDHFVAVRHDLHHAITKAFREADIEIAFPQRDLHVRSIGDLNKLVERRQDLTTDEKPAWAEPE